MDGLRRAFQLAREDFLDYKKSLFFCGKMLQYADSDYWRVPARLEMALTYRAMGDWDKAQKEYDVIAQGDERQRARMLVPQAEMVYFDFGDRQRGRKLLEAALRNEEVNDRERYGAVMDLASRALADGHRDEALRWYAMLETLPTEKPSERDSFVARAWYEMGRIEESLGRKAEAKALYRKAMNLEDGDMRYRVRARDALEDIEYFE
jgi:tetratricopeptide (TPR) repeat protein